MLEYSALFQKVKITAAYLLGDQVCLSYPMPDVINGVLVERFFLYNSGNSTERTRPFALLTVSMESGLIISYQDCRFSDFMDTEKHPFSENISYALPRKIGVKQYKAEQSLINELYESIREFAFKDELTDEQKEVLGKYFALLSQSVPAALYPYYLKMGKSFFSWGQPEA